MARIAGVDIPNEKRIVISLQYIYGIGETTAKNILKAANVSEDIRTKDLTEAQLGAIRSEVAKVKVEGDLRREVALNIKRLMEIGCYRGMRHRKGAFLLRLRLECWNIYAANTDIGDRNAP